MAYEVNRPGNSVVDRCYFSPKYKMLISKVVGVGKMAPRSVARQNCFSDSVGYFFSRKSRLAQFSIEDDGHAQLISISTDPMIEFAPNAPKTFPPITPQKPSASPALPADAAGELLRWSYRFPTHIRYYFYCAWLSHWHREVVIAVVHS